MKRDDRDYVNEVWRRWQRRRWWRATKAGQALDDLDAKAIAAARIIRRLAWRKMRGDQS